MRKKIAKKIARCRGGMNMRIKQATLSRLIEEEFKKMLMEGPKMGVDGSQTFESYRTVLSKAKEHAEAMNDANQAADVQSMYNYFVEKGWI